MTNINLSSIGAVIIGLAAMLLLSCGLDAPERCGSGKYYCKSITSTRPFEKPVQVVNDRYSHVILLSDGRVITNDYYFGDTLAIYDIKSLCSADTICFMKVLPYPYNSEGHFVSIAVAPTAVYIIRDLTTITQQFGNSGPDSTRLINALSVDINDLDKLYIIDFGDSSIKAFDFQGQFEMKIRTGGNPRIVKAFGDYFWVLDGNDNSISEYDTLGLATGKTCRSTLLDNVVDFCVIPGLFVVIDRGGSRVSILKLNGEIIEDKTSFCFREIDFEIGRLIAVNSDYTDFFLFDGENNYIIAFGDYYWDLAFSRRPLLY